MSQKNRLDRRADRPQHTPAIHLRRQKLSGPSRRHAGLGAAGQRCAADGPIVQISPPARPADRRFRRTQRAWSNCAAARGRNPTRAPRRPNCYDGLVAKSPEPLAVACIRRDGDQRPVVALPDRRVLLQDLHVAGGVLGKALRADHPPRRRSWHRCRCKDDPDVYDKGFLHCDLLIIGAGPAGLAAALTAGRAGARGDSGRRRFPHGRAAERRNLRAGRCSRCGLGRGNGGRTGQPCQMSA